MQLNPITILDKDGANVVFNPMGITNGVAELTGPGSSHDEKPVMAIRVNVNKATRATTSKLKITIPVVRVVDGVSTQVENQIVDISIRNPFIATDAEKANALAYAQSAPSVAALAPVMKGDETVY